MLYQLLTAIQHGPIFQSHKDYVYQILKSTYLLMKYSRLNLLISFIKEVFTFLPAGFTLSLLWYKYRNYPLPKPLIWLSVLFLPGIFFYFVSGFAIYDTNLFHIPAAGLGIWLGYVCWQIYEFMLGKKIL